jgi:hypothetical protein
MRLPASLHRRNQNERPAGIHEHWCEHPGCKKWGSFGVPGRHGTIWFCGEHNPEMKPGGECEVWPNGTSS